MATLPALPPGFAADILPKFRAHDIACMTHHQVLLSDAAWMRNPTGNADYPDHANARRVYAQLSSGHMPTDGPWPADWVTLFNSWMTAGFQP